MTGRFVDAAFIAADLGVSLATAYRYMNEMYALRTGGTVRVRRQRYEAWLRQRSGWAADENPTDASSDEAQHGGESSRDREERRSAKRSESLQRNLKMTRSPCGSLAPENIVLPKPRRQRRA